MILRLPIDCGERTCASSPGNFCRFAGSVRFGGVFVCRLFPSENVAHTVLAEEEGWLMRCDQCMRFSEEKP